MAELVVFLIVFVEASGVCATAVARLLPSPSRWERGRGVRAVSPLYPENLPAANNLISWLVAPSSARSARISPTTGANLKPWPEKPQA